MTNSVLDRFFEVSNQFDGVEPNTSGGGGKGWWPPEGEYECILTDIDIEEQEFTFKEPVPTAFPGVVVRFVYKLVNDTFNKEPVAIRGERIFLPLITKDQVNALPEKPKNQKARVRIAQERLLGCITSLNQGVVPSNVPQTLKKFKARIEELKSSSKDMIVKTRFKYRDEIRDGVKQRIADADFITSLLSG